MLKKKRPGKASETSQNATPPKRQEKFCSSKEGEKEKSAVRQEEKQGKGNAPSAQPLGKGKMGAQARRNDPHDNN